MRKLKGYNQMQFLNESLAKLQKYIEAEQYAGYDIYDGLKNTKNNFLLHNYLTNTFITQFFKKSPINLRSIFGIEKTIMPKTIGLVLNAYCNLLQCSDSNKKIKELFDKAEFCKNWLLKKALTVYSGTCWNFGFNYKLMFDKPTVVITSINVKSLYNYYQLTNCEETKKTIVSVKNFILNDLHITKTSYGICFSYTPVKADCCYNANMLAAETLARIYAIEKDYTLIPIINSALDFTLNHQKEDGRWNYSINIKTGKERKQVDFHQGYILESLFNIINLCEFKNQKYINSLKKGAEFYFNQQFDKYGRSFWRYPKKFPIDIHNQAQGILTFSLLKDLDKTYFRFAQTIAEWTIRNMQSESGYFYYQVHRFYKNKISYMRWSNAWMFLALSSLLNKYLS